MQAHTTMSSSLINPGRPVQLITSELKLAYNDHVDDPAVLITGVKTGSNQEIEMLLTPEFNLKVIKFDNEAIFLESNSNSLNVSVANNQYQLVKIIMHREILIINQDLPNLPPLRTRQFFPCLLVDVEFDPIRPSKDDYDLIRNIMQEGFMNITGMLLQSLDENGDPSQQYALFNSGHCQMTDLNVEIVKILIGCEANINKRDKDGQSLLHSALNDRGMYYQYLEEGEPDIVNAFKKIDRKFFHPTVRCIETLVKLQTNLNVIDCDAQTPIYLAVRYNDLESAKIILEKKPNLHIQCYDGKMALHQAVSNRNLKMVEILLEKNANVHSDSFDKKTPLFFSLRRLAVSEDDYNENRKKIMIALLNKGANPNIESRIEGLLLTAAINRDDLVAVETLLKYNADVNFRNKKRQCPLNGLIQLEEFGRNYRVELRLKYVKILLENGADVHVTDKIGETALHSAAKIYDAHPIVEILLKYGAHVNVKSEYGRTPLHYACRIRNFEMIKTLLNYNADIRMRDNKGRTTLHFAAWGGYWSGIDDRETQLQSIIDLLKVYIDINDKDSDGRTPLHAACGLDKFGIDYVPEFLDSRDLIASILIKSGASVNALDTRGKSPIYYAIKNNYFGILEVLINNGADINILDKKNESALQKHFNDLQPDDHTRLYLNAFVHVFLEHIIKLNYVKFYVCKQNLDIVFNDNERNKKWIEKYQISCGEELTRMKLEKVPNSRISFYDLLMKEIHDLVYLINNNDLIESLSSDEFVREFPIYGHILRCRFAEGQKRSPLVQRARVITKSNIFEKLPDLCIFETLRYLTTDELVMLIDITKSAVIDKVE